MSWSNSTILFSYERGPKKIVGRYSQRYWRLCGPRDFVVGTSYLTDLSVPNGPASQSITWNRALKPIGWKQHPGNASANHASNLYLLPHMPIAGALSHTKPGTNVSHLTINTHKCRVSVDGILRRVVNNRPLRESRETCSSIFIVPSLNTWEVYSSQLYPHCLVLFLFFSFSRGIY